MKKLSQILVLFMISTTLAFGQTYNSTESALESEDNFGLEMNAENSSQEATAEALEKFTTKIDLKILHAERENENIEVSATKLSGLLDRVFARNARNAERILTNEHMLNRAYNRYLQFNSSLTKESFVQSLKQSVDSSFSAQAKSKIIDILIRAGSYARFLQIYKKEMLERMGFLSSGAKAHSQFSGDDGTYIPLPLFFLLLLAIFSSALGGLIALIFGVSFFAAMGLACAVIVLALTIFILCEHFFGENQIQNRTSDHIASLLIKGKKMKWIEMPIA